MVLERFVETRSAYGWGLVCHALAGALRSVLGDWHLHVSQMEHQQLQGKLDLPVRTPPPHIKSLCTCRHPHAVNCIAKQGLCVVEVVEGYCGS